MIYQYTKTVHLYTSIPLVYNGKLECLATRKCGSASYYSSIHPIQSKTQRGEKNETAANQIASSKATLASKRDNLCKERKVPLSSGRFPKRERHDSDKDGP
jgi:hypothetical protein